LSCNLFFEQFTAEHQCEPVIFPFFDIIWNVFLRKHTYLSTCYKKRLPWLPSIASNENEYISIYISYIVYTLLLFTEFLQLLF
jgi:hypothetical protein